MSNNGGLKAPDVSVQAIAEIVRLLEPLDFHWRRRVLLAVAALLEIPID